MHCELVVPGLFAGEAPGRLEALELLLARGRCSGGSRSGPRSLSLERWLAEAFELSAPLPAGAATLLAAGGEPGAQDWVRADPVHLRLMRDRLVLVPAAALHLSDEEAATLCTHLNKHFSGRLELRVIDAERWVARMPAISGLGVESPLSLAGHDIQLTAGGDSTVSHQLLNETQMALHDHAVNEAREARGEAPVNSLWFWGAGRLAALSAPRFTSVWASEPLALGLARAARIGAQPLPASGAAWLDTGPAEGRHLLVLDALRTPLALSEPGEYAEALAAMERDWFSPLLSALRDGRTGMITVHVPDGPECVAFETIRGDLRRFWKRPKALASYA